MSVVSAEHGLDDDDELPNVGRKARGRRKRASICTFVDGFLQIVELKLLSDGVRRGHTALFLRLY